MNDKCNNEVIINKIKMYDVIDLSILYQLMDEFGKTNVLSAFKVFFKGLTKMEINTKYFDVFLFSIIGDKEPSEDYFMSLCNTYGDEKIVSYFTKIRTIKEDDDIFDDALDDDSYDIGDYDDDLSSCVNDSIKSYLKEIGNKKLLSPEEEKKIFCKLLRYKNLIEIAFFDEKFIDFFNINSVLLSINNKILWKKLKKINKNTNKQRVTIDKFLNLFISNKDNFICPDVKKISDLFEIDVQDVDIIDSNYLERQFDYIIKYYVTYNEIVEANLRLVVPAAKRNAGKGLEFMDLVQAGNLGLMKAVYRFDVTKGTKFSTYATWWIKQSVNRTIADLGKTIRIPVHMLSFIYKIKEEQKRLATELGRTPSIDDIANYSKYSREKIIEAIKMESITQIISLDLPVNRDDEDTPLSAFIPSNCADPEDSAINNDLNRQLYDKLNVLPEKYKRILMLRFGLIDGREHTLEEIGIEFGLTRERIRQIETKSLKRLKHIYKKN